MTKAELATRVAELEEALANKRGFQVPHNVIDALQAIHKLGGQQGAIAQEALRSL